jgi:hypothetical protein
MSKGLDFFLVRKDAELEELLELTERLIFTPNPTIIKENEVIFFVLISSERLLAPTLWIQDVPLSCAGEEIEPQGKYKYYWEPSDNKTVFLNHFGQSVLTVESRRLSSNEALLLYTTVEVVARKLNAERGEQMLSYLETKMDDITRFCFSVTHKKASSTYVNERHASILLQQIKEGLQVITSNLSRFLERKRCRLIPRLAQVNMNMATNLTESSTSWILSHLDSLIPAVAPSPTSISIKNRKFEIHDVEAEILHADTDVYENRVIAGYLENIGFVLDEIEKEYKRLMEALEVEESISNIPIGYQSMSELRQKFACKYYGKLLSQCRELQTLHKKCTSFFQKHLPVRYSLHELPEMTTGFMGYTHYRKAFEQIVNWHRTGRLNLSGEHYLYGLRSLDKLYEFFCLYQLIEALKGCGLELIEVRSSNRAKPKYMGWDAQPADYYIFSGLGGEKVSLRYEPVILPPPNNESELLDTKHSGQRVHSKWVPDFILEIHNHQLSTYVILDAKYTTPKLAIDRYLPELTMNYVHGTGQKGGGPSLVLALYILHPRDTSMASKDFIRLHHQKMFDIFSPTPALPSLGTISITPGPIDELVEQDKTSQLRILLKQTIHVLRYTAKTGMLNPT